MTLDLAMSYFLLCLALLGVCLYLARIFLYGRAQYERIDRQGGSALLNKEVMVMGYWWFKPLGHFCFRHRISANQISWLSFTCGCIASIYIAFGKFGIAAFFILMTGFLDVVDGMVARISGSSDPAGVVLDSSLDRYVDFFILAGLLIYYRQSLPLVCITMAAMLGSFMISYSTAKAESMQITPPRGTMKRSERMVYLIGAAILSPLSIAYIELDWPYQPALALPMLMVVTLIAVAANLSSVRRLRKLALSARENTK